MASFTDLSQHFHSEATNFLAYPRIAAPETVLLFWGSELKAACPAVHLSAQIVSLCGFEKVSWSKIMWRPSAADEQKLKRV